MRSNLPDGKLSISESAMRLIEGARAWMRPRVKGAIASLRSRVCSGGSSSRSECASTALNAGRCVLALGFRASGISRLVHDMVVARGGSFSAEHGLGRLKVAALERYADPAKLSAMRAIKAALDPKGIMNPGAVLATH